VDAAITSLRVAASAVPLDQAPLGPPAGRDWKA
jgi:hypothetical protein